MFVKYTLTNADNYFVCVKYSVTKTSNYFVCVKYTLTNADNYFVCVKYSVTKTSNYFVCVKYSVTKANTYLCVKYSLINCPSTHHAPPLLTVYSSPRHLPLQLTTATARGPEIVSRCVTMCHCVLRHVTVGSVCQDESRPIPLYELL